jgi:hypothetical protein
MMCSYQKTKGAAGAVFFDQRLSKIIAFKITA